MEEQLAKLRADLGVLHRMQALLADDAKHKLREILQLRRQMMEEGQ